MVDLTGLEPVTFALQMQCSKPAELQAQIKHDKVLVKLKLI